MNREFVTTSKVLRLNRSASEFRKHEHRGVEVLAKKEQGVAYNQLDQEYHLDHYGVARIFQANLQK